MQVAPVLIRPDEPGRHLLDDRQPQLLEQGQEIGERRLAAGLVELEPGERLRRPLLVLKGDDVRPLGAEQLELLDVERRLVDRRRRLVVVGEPGRVPAGELVPAPHAPRGHEGVRERVVPASRRVGDLALELGQRGVGDVARRDVDREVKPGRIGRKRQRVVHRAAAEAKLEQVLEPDPQVGRHVVARQGDDRRHRPPHRVAAQEEPHAALLLHAQERHDRHPELRRRGREELVLGEAVEERDDRLVVVRPGDQVLPLHDGLELPPDERDLARRLGVGLGREEADQPQLAHHRARGVDPLHADVVHPRLAMDGGLGVGLRHDHQRAAEDPLPHRLVEPGHRQRRREPRPRLVGEHAETGAGHHSGRRLPVHLGDPVLAVAEVDEVVVGEPAQKLDRFVHLVGWVPRGGRLGRLDHPLDALDHRQEVAHRKPKPCQAVAQGGLERLKLGGAQAAVGLEVHDRLAPRRAAGRGDRLDGAVGPTLDAHNRVQNEPHLTAEVVQLGGDGVDQERRIVGVHLDHRARRRPAVAFGIRVIGPDSQLAGRTPVREGEHAPHLRGQLGRVVLGPKRLRRAADVRPHELGKRAGPAGVELGQDLVDQRGAALVRLGDGRRLVLGAHER